MSPFTNGPALTSALLSHMILLRITRNCQHTTIPIFSVGDPDARTSAVI